MISPNEPKAKKKKKKKKKKKSVQLVRYTASTTFSTTSKSKCDQKPTADFVERETYCSAHDRTSAEIHMWFADQNQQTTIHAIVKIIVIVK